MAHLTAITTCKGRLAHLRQTLPSLMAAPDLDVIVVDYDCPEKAGDWVRAAWPQARVVAVSDRPLFNLSEARNLGAAAATTDWLVFLDADVGVAKGFATAVEPRLQPNVFLLADPRPAELWGALIVSRADFEAAGGYDEVFQGWGVEDVDILERLMIACLTEGGFPSAVLNSISHDEGLRTRFHEISDTQLNATINGLYRIAKNDLLRHGLELNLDARRKLYADVRNGFTAPGGMQSFQIGYRETFVQNVNITASLRYELKPRSPG